MTAKGHVLLALPVVLYAGQSMGLDRLDSILFAAAALLSVLAPDIDEPGSYIGRRFWFLSWPIKALSFLFPSFKHRGITHIFLIPFLMILIASLSRNITLAGFGLGWMLHTVGDMLTIGGIKGYLYPLWPDKKIVLLPDGFRFRTGGFAENILIFILLILNAYGTYAYLDYLSFW